MIWKYEIDYNTSKFSIEPIHHVVLIELFENILLELAEGNSQKLYIVVTASNCLHVFKKYKWLVLPKFQLNALIEKKDAKTLKNKSMSHLTF